MTDNLRIDPDALAGLDVTVLDEAAVAYRSRRLRVLAGLVGGMASARKEAPHA